MTDRFCTPHSAAARRAASADMTLNRIYRSLRPTACGLAAWGLLAQVAAAQTPQGGGDSGMNYIPAYVVVALAIGLGGYLFTLPSKRDEYEDLGPNVRVGSGIRGEDFHEKED